MDGTQLEQLFLAPTQTSERKEPKNAEKQGPREPTDRPAIANSKSTQPKVRLSRAWS